MNQKQLLVVLPVVAILLASSLPLGIVKAQDKTLFRITIIAPGNANMVRRQWGQLIANSFRQLGIDARVVYLGWTGVYDRVFLPLPENVGKTWEEGGYDAELVGWTPGLIPEPRQLFSGHQGFLAPNGQNYYLWVNSTNDGLLDKFITSTDPAEQEQTLMDWQSLEFDAVPVSQIVYQSRPSFVNPQVTFDGDWWLHFNAQPGPEYISGKTTVVYASTGEIQSLIPPTSNSWYDTIIIAPIFNGLAQVAPDMSDFATPALLTNWQTSDNGFTWTFTCRQGVKWHDGADFTADDVIFSLWALMNSNTGSQFVGYFQSVYGDNVDFTYSNGTTTHIGTGTRTGNITALDAYTVQANLPELALGKPYGYFDPYLLAIANNIIPKHIFENLDVATWSATPFNTGQGSITVNGITYTGPVGTGPYKWDSYDPVSQLIKLVKNNDYWDRANLEAKGDFGVTEYYIKFIADKTPAIASLKNGEVDILDPNYEMNVDAATVDPTWATIIQQDGAGRQELGYNMQHPIWGTGVDTPLGRQNPSRAAEAAKYIRQAFDYAIPRQLIIDNLLDGAGQLGATPMLPTQAFYNADIDARPYDLNKARELLTKAGYTVPGYTPGQPPIPPISNATGPVVAGFFQGMSSVISGTYIQDGNPVPNTEIQLWATKDNATYTTSSVLLDQKKTDLNGFYTFPVTPTSNGTWYYYLFEGTRPAGEEWMYTGKIDVLSISAAFGPISTGIVTLQQKSNVTQASIAQLQASNTQLSNQITELSNQLKASQSNATNAMFLGGGALIIALIVGVLVLMRTRREE